MLLRRRWAVWAGGNQGRRPRDRRLGPLNPPKWLATTEGAGIAPGNPSPLGSSRLPSYVLGERQLKASTTLIVAVALMGSPAVAQEAPETWGRYFVGSGHEWTAASVALNDDGTVSEDLAPNLRRELEKQQKRFERRFGSAAAHGFSDHDSPPSEFCPRGTYINWMGPDDGGMFGATILLSEVAVTASVGDVVLGFRSYGYPAALLALEDAEPLHGRTPIPSYALVPIGEVVVRDRVYCSLGEVGPVPHVGSRVVVLGSWHAGTVLNAHARTGSYAVLGEDGSLNWRFGTRGSSTIGGLRRRIREIESRNLFAVTDDLVRQRPNSAERLRFIAAWRRYSDAGCTPSTDLTDDGRAVLVPCNG